MTAPRKTNDVFISHSAEDSWLASRIAEACRLNGLDAITDGELLAGDNPGDLVWDAVAESRAVLVILSRSGLTPSMGIEVGAAQAWNKPMFGIIPDPTYTDIPSGLSGLHLYTPARIPDVIRAIKHSSAELSEDDRASLIGLYGDLGIPVDQLTLDPRDLEALVSRFREATGKSLSGERILTELLRMRKRGQLKTMAKSRPRTRKVQ